MMSRIKWDDSMSVNISEIDQQHKQLITIINDLHEAMSEGRGKKILRVILRQLTDYTEIHFETEEIYFDKYKFPDAKNHNAEHAEFIQKISEFRFFVFPKTKN